MIRSRCSLGPLGSRLLAILIVCLAPAAAAANTLVLTNECRSPVVVHTSVVVNGRLVRNRSFMLRPAESSPAIPRTNDLTITICDARAVNRVLFQGALRAGTNKLYFGIAPDKMPGKVQVIRRAAPPGGVAPGKMPNPRR